MIELLNEISESPGILGACIYSTEQGILATNLPVEMSSSVQQKFGQLLQQIFELKDSKTLDISTFEIQFDNSLIMTKKLNGRAALFTLCLPDVNLSLVNMSINMLNDDLLVALEKCQQLSTSPPALHPPAEQPEPQPDNQVKSYSSRASAALNMLDDDMLSALNLGNNKAMQKPAPEPALKPTPVPASTPLTAQTKSYAEIITGPLAAELQMIKAALSKSIGPFTGIVLEDGINEWLKSGMSKRSELNELIQILAKDIEEQSPRQSFINDLTMIFSA